MSAHTPGPWGIGWNGGLTGPRCAPTCHIPYQTSAIVPIHRGNNAVCFVMASAREESELAALKESLMPDARLIAAAPRMYDRLALLAAEGDSEAVSILEAVNGRA